MPLFEELDTLLVSHLSAAHLFRRHESVVYSAGRISCCQDRDLAFCNPAANKDYSPMIVAVIGFSLELFLHIKHNIVKMASSSFNGRSACPSTLSLDHG